MYRFGDCRNEILSPRASRSRSRWRIFSRSRATAFIRLDRLSVASRGMASVSTVAVAATAANSIVRKRGSCRRAMSWSIMVTGSLEVEVDHFTHYDYPDRHPDERSNHHQLSKRLRPKKLDVGRGSEVNDCGHRNRQGGDDEGGSFRLHGHSGDLGLHLLALTQHARKITKRLRQIAAGFLLDGDD